jgi:hypothetical protein
MYSGGYTSILRVNLTDRTAKKEKLPLKVWGFIGGQDSASIASTTRVKQGRIDGS